MRGGLASRHTYVRSLNKDHIDHVLPYADHDHLISLLLLEMRPEIDNLEFGSGIKQSFTRGASPEVIQGNLPRYLFVSRQNSNRSH